MANYWDTFNPGLLAGENYWEDFTPEAPTQTGILESGQRYQPWEKEYHKTAGLLDDSGQYDAWYDPDPPPETSSPSWATPEGYGNWADRIALETGKTGGGLYPPEGGAGEPVDGSFGGEDFSKVKDFLASGSVANAILGFGLGGPVGALLGAYGGQIKDVISDILDSSSGWWGGKEATTGDTVEKSGFIADVNTPTVNEGFVNEVSTPSIYDS